MRDVNSDEEAPIVSKLTRRKEKTPDKSKRLPNSGQNDHYREKKRGY